MKYFLFIAPGKLTQQRWLFFVLGALLQGSTLGATNYYFAANGTPSASGLSVRNAINNIVRISTLPLKAGDTVFFRRGDRFRGSFEIGASGTEKAPLVFAAYGKGGLPVICGSVLLDKWKKEESGLWSHQVEKEVFELFVDGTRQTIARFPNSGFLPIDSGVGKNKLFSEALMNTTASLEGATIRMRTIDWVYEMRKVTGSGMGWLNFGFHPQYRDGRGMHVRSTNSTTTIYNLVKGYGFYLDGLPQFIDSVGEWAQQDNQVLLRMAEAPAKRNVEATTVQAAISITDGVKHLVIQDLHVTQFFHHGIKGGEGLRDITIQNCTLNNINTAAIDIDSGSLNIVIRNCLLQDISGKGIALLEAVAALIEDCTVRRIGLVPGYGYTGVNGGTAISITNIESKTYKKERYTYLCAVRRNKVDSCGYNGIRVDGNHNLVEQNTIRYCGLTLNDGSALYCFAAQPGITFNSLFRNNIVLHSRGNIDGTPANDIHFNGIYIDNNCHDMVVEGNTSAWHSSSGIVNNDASYRNAFRNNVVFSCGSGINYAEWAIHGRIFGCTTDGNTVVATKPDQHVVAMLNFIGDSTSFSSFDNNTYIHTARSNGFKRETKHLPQNSKLFLSFRDWQKLMHEDRNSRSLSLADSLLKDYSPELIINTERKIMEWNPGAGAFLSLKGEVLQKVLQVMPFRSVVVLKRKAE